MAQITEKRSPEWIMNMILNPEEMLQKDAIAQELLRDYNGVTMSNQHLTQEEARAILEFLRTL
ncbi:Cytochrome c class I (fragment) [Capnocytophaga canimorsus]